MATRILDPKVDRLESTPDMAWESNEGRLNDLEDEVFVKVVFMSNDIVYNTQLVVPNEKAVQPADPALDGYVFSGWYEEDTFETEFDFDTAITEDTTIYAKWEEED